jgi:hypothetical protein
LLDELVEKSVDEVTLHSNGSCSVADEDRGEGAI